jgi:hypothetical protein
VTCTFTNTKNGRIVIRKDISPKSRQPYDPAQMFEFEPSWTENFSLGNKQSFDTSYTLAPGRYSVTEVNLPAGWTLLQLSCSDPTGGTTTSLATRTASIDLATGETVTCKFLNFKR